MATNELTTLRNALVTIVEGDATMQTHAGRASGFLVLWRSGLTFTAPTVAMLLPSNPRTGGNGNRRLVSVFLGAYATGNGAQDTVEAMTRRLREIITTPALRAAGVNANAIVSADERGVDPDTTDTVAQEARHDLDVTIELQAPT